MNQPREFPNWEQLYQEKAVESMPWFNSGIDPDLDHALDQMGIKNGLALDLGTGPGTQAIALAQKGLQVTATDLSETAIAKAVDLAKEKGLTIAFKQDDILNTLLNQSFDIVFDRGCFHVLPPDRRSDYVETVAQLVKPQGFLFLKCFSSLETRESGPYRFTPQEIEAIFQRFFEAHSVEQTVYHGTLDPFPKALFCVLQRV